MNHPMYKKITDSVAEMVVCDVKPVIIFEKKGSDI